MPGLDELRAKAEKMASEHGHRIDSWTSPWHGESGSVQMACCNNDECDAEVWIGKTIYDKAILKPCPVAEEDEG